jgi:hypothetical protein
VSRPARVADVDRRPELDDLSRRRQRLRASVALGVVLCVSYAFFYPGGGWNQNTRLDLARAVTEHGSLRIDEYAANTGDKARHQGHYYSDKAPGQPLLAVPAVAITRPFLAATGIPVDSRRATHVMMYVATVLTSSLPAAVAGVALFWVLAELGASMAAATVSVLAFGLATPIWAYASLLWSHPLSTACLFLAFAGCLARSRTADAAARRRATYAVGIGLAAGWAAITDLPVAPAAAIIAVLALATAGPHDHRWRLVAQLAVGAAVPLAVLGAYNALAFGSPVHLGYQSEVGFTRLHHGVLGITYPRLDVALSLLAGPSRGLLFLAPELVVAPIGLVLLARRRSARPFALAAGAMVVYFLLFNASYVYWTGGRAVGPRFLAPALPFLCLGLAPLWDRARRLGRTSIAALTLAGAVVMLAVVATTAQPVVDANPLVDIVWPAVRHNLVAVGSEPYRDAVIDRGVAASTDRSDASNAGLLLGLPNLLSVVPLAVAWVVVGSAWLRTRRPAWSGR